MAKVQQVRILTPEAPEDGVVRTKARVVHDLREHGFGVADGASNATLADLISECRFANTGKRTLIRVENA